MSFLSLYRKYRPQKFNDLVGQEHVVQTLVNALKNNRIAHAYLFAGPRGTGKTSTAKVFAMALNCQDDESIEPCGSCLNCDNIQKGQSIDVIEIDAASNRGIDEIRELREKVKFYPGEGKYKVYIIDEVHMLTRGAFNALLKTLEEPPESVVFILATTEPHKVISTILSRCQRFDFSLLSAGDIQERLEYICSREKVEYDKESLINLAHNANGGLRDAISLLDQAISYTNGQLTAAQIQKMLGKVHREVLSEFLQFIKNHDSAGALKMLSQLIDEGLSVARFINDLTEYCRQLLLIKECGIDAGIIEFSEEVLISMQQESKLFASRRLLQFIDVLAGIDGKIKYSSNSRQILELGIIKMASHKDDTETLQGLKNKIYELEEKLNNMQGNSTIKSNNKEYKGKKSVNEQVNTKNQTNQTNNDKTDVEDNKNEDKDKLSIDRVRKKWPDVLRELKKKDITAHALLIEGKIVAAENNMLSIEFPADKDFHKKNAEQKSDLINKAFNQILKNPCRLQFRLAGGVKSKKKVKTDRKEKDIADKIARIFGGQVIEVDQKVLEN